MKHTIKFIIIIFCFLILIGGCTSDSVTDSTKDKTDPEKTTENVIIATDGGTVNSETGKAKLIIPAGALENNLAITIKSEPKTGQPDEGNLGSPVYDFGPDGTNFKKPVIISLEMDVPVPSGKQAVMATLVGEKWVNLEVSKAVGSSVSAEVTHFSKYVVLFIPDTNMQDTLDVPNTDVQDTLDRGTMQVNSTAFNIEGIVVGLTDERFSLSAMSKEKQYTVSVFKKPPLPSVETTYGLSHFVTDTTVNLGITDKAFNSWGTKGEIDGHVIITPVADKQFKINFQNIALSDLSNRTDSVVVISSEIKFGVYPGALTLDTTTYSVAATNASVASSYGTLVISAFMTAKNGSKVDLKITFDKNAESGSLEVNKNKIEMNNPGKGKVSIIAHVRTMPSEAHNQAQSGSVNLVRNGNVLEVIFSEIPYKNNYSGGPENPAEMPKMSGKIESIIQ